MFFFLKTEIKLRIEQQKARKMFLTSLMAIFTTAWSRLREEVEPSAEPPNIA